MIVAWKSKIMSLRFSSDLRGRDGFARIRGTGSLVSFAVSVEKEFHVDNRTEYTLQEN